MKTREFVAWSLFVLASLLFAWEAYDYAQLMDVANEGVDLLADALEENEQMREICDAESAAAMERGNKLFECEMSICEANGWMPPVEAVDVPGVGHVVPEQR